MLSRMACTLVLILCGSLTPLEGYVKLVRSDGPCG